MATLTKLIDDFNPFSEEDIKTNQLKHLRLYSLLGVFFSVLITLSLYRYQHLYNHIFQSIIAIIFLAVIGLTYTKRYEEKIGKYFFWNIMFITLYVLYNTYFNKFSVNTTFCLLILFFVFSLVLRSKKEIVIFYTMVSVVGTIEIVLSNHTAISKPYLLCFFGIFAALGYIVTRSKNMVIEKLKEKEIFHKTLFNKAFDCILLVDYFTREVVDCNDVAVRMFEVEDKNEIIGYSREKFMKRKMNEDELLQCRKEFMKQGIWRGDAECVSKKGRVFWVEITITPLNLKSGQYYVTRMVDITFKKMTEKVIIENEMKYRSLVENMGEGILMSDLKGIITFVNERFCEMLETEKKELIGRIDTEAIKFTRESKKILLENVEIRKQGGYSKYEVEIETRKGNWIWAEISGAPVFDNEGNITGSMGIFTDITERKKTTTALKNSEEKMSMVLKSIDSMVYNVTFDKKEKKKLEYISPTVDKLFGYTKEQYDHNEINLLSRYHPDDMPMLMMEMRKLNLQKKPVTIRYRFKHFKTNKYNWIEERIFPKFNAKGKHIANFGIARNINEIIRSEQKIAESEERYRQMFEKNPLPMWIYDINTLGFIDVNDEAVKHYGYTKSEFLKMSILDICPKAEKGATGKAFNDIYSGNETNKLNEKKKHLKKDGTQIDVEIKTSRIRVKNRDLNIALVKDITLEKQMQEKIIESEKRFKILSESTFEGILLAINGKIIDSNNQFALMHGYGSREEIIGKKYDDFVIPEHRKKVYDYVRKTKNTAPIEILSRKKDGSLIAVESRGKNLTYKGKTIRVSAIRDISERKRYEKYLEESKQNFQKLVELSPDGIIIQIDGTTHYANSKALAIMGYDNIEELKSVNIYDALLPEYKEMANNRLKWIEKGKELPFIEVKIRQPNGKIIDLETKPISLMFQGKKAIQLVLHDITERKQLEKEQVRATIAEQINKQLKKEIEERKKIEKQLSDNEQYTRRIIDSSLDMICATDKNGNIVEFNKSAQRIFGYKPSEIIGRNVSILYAREEQRKIISNEVLKGKGTFSGEIINIKKNGEQFISYLSAAVLIGENSTIEGMVGVSRDITELKKAEEELRKSEDRYRDLFENATDLIQSVDIEGKILYVNNAWIDTLQYNKKEILGQSIYRFMHPKSIAHCKRIFSDLKKGRKANNVEMSFLTKKGRKVDVLGDINVKRENGHIVSTRGIFKDITEKKRNEEIQAIYYEVSEIAIHAETMAMMFAETHKTLNKVIDIKEMSVLLFDDQSKKFHIAHHRSKKYKNKKPSGIPYNAKMLSKIIQGIRPVLFRGKKLQQHLKQGLFSTDNEQLKAWLGIPLCVGEEKLGIIILQDFEDENSITKTHVEILEFISTSLSLAIQRKRDEKKITEQTARLRAIIESATNIMIWTLNKEMKLTGSNGNFDKTVSERLGITPFLGMDFLRSIKPFLHKTAYSNVNELYKKAVKGEPQHFEGKLKDKSGNDIWIETFLNPVLLKGRKIEEISALAVDITEKKQAEAELKNSLEEKEVLLKEVHHRVKNNLQVISSILNLQSSYVKDAKTVEMLQESQNRIKSMSFLHEKLYQTKDFTNIHFSEYVENIIQNLAHSYLIYNDSIATDKQISDIILDIDRAIPCGLIINELISNAYKHAFPDNRKGVVAIRIAKTQRRKVKIEIEDDGIGLPENIDLKNSESLGLQLVTALVEQINGTLQLKRNNGTKIIITFSI